MAFAIDLLEKAYSAQKKARRASNESWTRADYIKESNRILNDLAESPKGKMLWNKHAWHMYEELIDEQLKLEKEKNWD